MNNKVIIAIVIVVVLIAAGIGIGIAVSNNNNSGSSGVEYIGNGGTQSGTNIKTVTNDSSTISPIFISRRTTSHSSDTQRRQTVTERSTRSVTRHRASASSMQNTNPTQRCP